MLPCGPGFLDTVGECFAPLYSTERFTRFFKKKLVFFACSTAGMGVVDSANPYNPREVGYNIPATTENTDERCVNIDGQDRCKIAIQTNNLEVDDRGYIYLVDRANTGLHVVELTGAAREIAHYPN